MKSNELFEVLAQTLVPIIKEDQDIIDYKEGSNLSEEEYNTLLVWLASATICIMLNGHTGEAEQELVDNCKHDMKVAENKLTEAGFDDAKNMLCQILEENIEEWLEIVKKTFNKNKKEIDKDNETEDEDVTGSDEETTPAMSISAYHMFFLDQIIEREDDVLEFLDKYSCVERKSLKMYITTILFHWYLKQIKDGELKLAKGSLIAKHLDELIGLSEATITYLTKNCFKKIKDFDEFNEDFKELMDDHHIEFIKKMFKSISRFKEKNSK